MSGAVPCGLVQKDRNSASVRSIASVRVIPPLDADRIRRQREADGGDPRRSARLRSVCHEIVAVLVSFRKYANA